MEVSRSVLFVCTGNCCRSVMAALHFRFLAEKRGRNFISVESAGIRPVEGMKATAETVKLLRERGLDASAHVARRLTAEMAERADLIVVMEEKHRSAAGALTSSAAGKTVLLGDYCPEEYGIHPLDGIPDPIGMHESFYRNVEELIYKACEILVEQLPDGTGIPLAEITAAGSEK